MALTVNDLRKKYYESSGRTSEQSGNKTVDDLRKQYYSNKKTEAVSAPTTPSATQRQRAESREEERSKTSGFEVTKPLTPVQKQTVQNSNRRFQTVAERAENKSASTNVRAKGNSGGDTTSRVGKGLQSIGLNTAASTEYLIDTGKVAAKNQKEYANSIEKQLYAEALSNFNMVRSQYAEGTPEYQKAWAQLQKAQADLDKVGTATVDPNSRSSQFMAGVQQLQEEALEGTSGVGRFLGETALSIGSNVAKLPMNAILPGSSLALMGVEAAANKAYELQQQGVSAGKALGRGLVSGGIEALTEKVPLDNLVDIIKTGGKVGLMNILKQAATEAGEEGVAYLLNLGADKVAGDPEAEFVWNDFWKSVGMGALSGGIMGGGATAINRANAAAVGKNYQDVAPELVAEGLQMNQDTDAYRTAAEMQRKLDAGKNLSNVDVGRVVQDNEAAMSPLKQAAMEMAEEQVEREVQAAMPKRTAVRPLATEQRTAYTESNRTTEGGMTDGEKVHLRESGQRNDRAYPGGEVSRMEESAGAADARGRSEGGRTEEAARFGQVTADIEGGTVDADQVYQSPFEQRPVDPGTRQQGGVYRTSAGGTQGSSPGANGAGRYYQIGPRDFGLASRKVTTTAGLGIANGASNDRVYIVTDGETSDTKAAKDLARSNGLRVVLFGGGNLNIDGAECRAYISGDRVFVRVDHDQFTAEQLMKHEVAHNKMDKGEIKRDVALANTKRKLRERNVDIDKVCRAYLAALNGAKLSVDQIIEEIICDSEAGMNIFEDTPFESAYRTQVMENAKLDIENQMASAIENVAESEASTEVQDPGDDPTVHASYESLANAAGFAAVQNENGTRNYVRDGMVVKSVTVDDIDKSLIGKMIDYSIKDAEQQKAQKELFAGICTLAANTNDFSMSMTFAGSSVFTAMKANSDKQYGTTYDFPSICTKTQAVIDAMSAKMVREGRGLSKPEIEDLYQKVFAKGNPVPCPECYVFSRWVGIGGLLDNIKAYQDKYGNMDPAAVAKEYRAMESQIAEYALANGVEFGKAKGAMAAKTTKRYNELAEKISKARNQGQPIKESDVRQLEHLENMMTTAKALTWIKDVYFTDSSMKTRRKTFAVPDEVLFDLNQGETFARDYKAAWAFRTTQGAGYGKAITPYAEARLGEGILVTNNTPSTIKKKAAGKLDFKFLGEDGELTKDAKKAIDKAIVKQKTQAFLGGQRWQSTSDSRFENATDYLLAALELQTMKGMGQAYTKVDGAVAALSAWGISVNQSLMPLGGGLDANGNLQDTAVGGMNRDVALANRKKYETAGTITIGVNDNHIRTLIREEGRDFVIPYHASGGDQELISAFRKTQDPDAADAAAVRSTDYSRTQGDKILSDDVLRWMGKTDAEIEQIHARRKARLDILSGGTPDITVVRSSTFLSNLYDKFNGGEWSGVKVAKGKVERQIFPNEFWDKTVTYDQSAKITKDYLAYCEELGFLHRFSGKVPQNGVLKPVTGYDQNGQKVQLTDLAYKVDENGQNTGEVEPFFWKTITDRRMYGNDGRYLEQKIVTLNDTKQETVTGFARRNVGRQYNKAKSDELVEEIKRGKASRETNREDVLKAVEKLLEEYGPIEPGENPFRSIQIPRKTSKTKNVSKTVRTILEAEATPDAMIPDVEALVAEGALSFESYTDEQAIADATAKLQTRGWSNTLSKWISDVDKGVVTKENTVTGWALYNNAANKGDVETALTILQKMVGHQRNAAQALQATRVLKKLSPDAQLYGVQRSVQDLQDELNKKYGDDKAPQLKIDPELGEKFMRAETDAERDEVMGEIYRDIGKQMPSTFRDKWNAWRYLAMLGNARTHVRNIVGNAGFAPVVGVKNITATGIEALVNGVGGFVETVSGGKYGGKIDRTKAITADKAMLKAAWEDYGNVADEISNGGKYSDFQNANNQIEAGRVIFKNKALEKARTFNSAAMEKEDTWFSKPHYAAALASYCKANGITAQQIAKGGKAMDKARAYAIKEAQKATYRDTNALSQAFGEIGGKWRTSSNPVKKGVGIAIEGILPFRKTPANILARGVEYSPIGLMNGIKKAVWDVQKGNATAAEAIDNISAGLTGSMLMALGAFLAAQGLIRGGGEGDDKEKEFAELQGHQTYAMELPNGKSVTLDWLAPEALPFFIGVNFFESTQGKKEEMDIDSIIGSVTSITEPLLEMSCLQGLNDLIDSVGYASGRDVNSLVAMAASAATSYLTQALPTLGGQLERSFQKERMTTYSDKNKRWIPADLQYTIGKATAKIPVLDYQQIPYIDAWGRTESTGNFVENAFGNLLNPSYTSQIDTTAMEDELLRLYRSTGKSVFPNRADRYFMVNSKRKDLTAEEYVQYATLKGRYSYELLTELVDSSAYKSLTDAEKAKMVSEVFDNANAQAKAAISEYKLDEWAAKYAEAEKKYGIKQEVFAEVRMNTRFLESLKDKKSGETITNSLSLLKMEAVYNIPGLTDKQRKALFDYLDVGKSVRHYNKSLVKQKLASMRRGAK